MLRGLSDTEIAALYWHWDFWARPDQMPPEGDWSSWMMLGGRGAGKTRAGAEWVRARIEAPLHKHPARRIALIGETFAAARAVMVEGVSGLLAISPPDLRPQFLPSRNLLIWPNGAEAQIFSAERPDALRGPQFDLAWCDELAKWRYDEACWDMLQFGLRLGAQPRQMVSTTPRPTPLIKQLLGDPNCAVTRAETKANAANLADGFIARIEARYGGTNMGRQELEGALIDDVPGALWTHGLIEQCRVKAAPKAMQIIVALDPPAGIGPNADACGIIIAARSEDNKAYVLDDYTVQGVSPQKWSARAIAAYRDYQATALIAEVNQGGELVREIVLRDAPDLVFHPVRAIAGKLMRAEPVAALYERGRVLHVGRHDALEDEMCSYVGRGRSPDRLDALVWAVSWLLLRPAGPTPPRLRSL